MEMRSPVDNLEYKKKYSSITLIAESRIMYVLVPKAIVFNLMLYSGKKYTIKQNKSYKICFWVLS